MSFCGNCGNQIMEGAKFCPFCGSNVLNTGDRNTKTGILHKCPSCGEVLNSFEVACPSCGYELRGTKVSSSIQNFVQELSLSKSDDRTVFIIRSFPIPNTKEDIFEFMIFASTNITGEQRKDVFDAWLVKFEQSYQKAQLVMKDTSDLRKIVEIYDKTNRQIKKEKFFQNAKAARESLYRTGGLLSTILMIVSKSAAAIVGVILFIVAINIDKSGGNASMYELIGVILLIISAVMLKRRKVSYAEIFIGGISGILSFHLANDLENGSMLELGGAVVLIIVAVNFFKKLGQKGE